MHRRDGKAEEIQKNILLVEDEAIIAMMESRLLENAGYRVLHALDGRKAIDIVDSNPEAVDLILMDIDLGKGMDGTETASEILKNHEIPVVFFSSHVEKEIVQKTEKITSYGYVVKNSGIIVLDASIKMAFKLFSAHRSIQAQKTEIETAYEELKKAEGRLLKSEELFRQAFMTSPDAININRLEDGMYVSTNDGFRKIIGYSTNEVLGKTSFDINIWVDPEDRKRLVKGLRERGQVENLEAKFRKKDGSVVTGLMSASIIKLDGMDHILSITRDIEEMRRFRDDIKSREAVHRTMIANISDVIAIMDAAGIIRYKSPNIERWFGWRPEDLVGTNGWDTVHPDDLPRIQNEYFQLLRTEGALKTVEYRYKCGDGSYRLIELTAVNLLNDEYIRGVLMNYHDITERKRAEDTIKLNEARLESLLRINQHPSRSIQELLDFALGEAISLTGSKIGYIYFYDDEARVLTLNTWSKDVMKHCSIENPMSRYALDKTGIWGEAVRQARPIVVNDFEAPNPLKKGLPPGHAPLRKFLTIPVFSEGRIVAVVGVANKQNDYDETDIRQMNLMMDSVWKFVLKKRIENALRESEEKYRVLLDASSDPIFSFSSEGRYLYVNRAFAEGVQKKREEIVGRRIEDVFSREEAEKRAAALKQVFASGVEKIIEARVPRTDGERFYLTTITPIKDQAGATRSVICSSKDITEQKRAREAVQGLLREKELILKEVHHRVKNNMNTIVSLLKIQAAGQEKDQSKNQLLEAAGQAQSMMVLYDKLYNSDLSGFLSLQAYFPALIREIIALFPLKFPIKITTEFDDITLSGKTLSSLGLIVNELITNAIKYAFEGREDGQLAIRGFRKGRMLILEFQDDGVGLPNDTSFETSPGFGLQLVSMLTKQLEGTISVDRENGTRFVIELALD